MGGEQFRFLKGHGTENDFVLLPDVDGTTHSDLSADLVRRLCDRNAGIGADGILRVVRREGEWFMDYRNADGSIGEMCGNGIRVFARYLIDFEGLCAEQIAIGTRAGVKVVHVGAGGDMTVDMGSPQVLGETKVAANGHAWPATHVSMGNPHAVVFVDDLADAGSLHEPPQHEAQVFPDGVNVEFVVRKGERSLAMRVHERGSGETRSCGTGACAAMVAAAHADEAGPGTTYRVEVPGGRLDVAWREDGHVLLSGPAVIVAEGKWVA